MSRAAPLFLHRIPGPMPAPDAPPVPYWSVSKTVIALCALRLAEERRLDLDALLPDLGVTLHQLLNHTAGLPDYFTLPAYRESVARDDEPWSPDDLLRAALAQDRLFAPGQGWAYSNVGYLLARRVIEEAAGLPLGEVVQDRICVPLGLRSIRLATGREDFRDLPFPDARFYHPGWVYHGCLIGTAEDAARLMHALFTGGILGPGSLARMKAARALGGALPGRPWTECGYGLGLMCGRFGAAGRVLGHSGGGPFSVCAVYHFPDLPVPMTAAAFSGGGNEGIAEFAVQDAALAPLAPGPEA